MPQFILYKEFKFYKHRKVTPMSGFKHAFEWALSGSKDYWSKKYKSGTNDIFWLKKVELA